MAEALPSIHGVLLCDDLIFASRITGTAQVLGYTIKPVRAMEQVAAAVQQASVVCVVVDLSYPGLRIADLVQQLRGQQPALQIVAYGSHVDTASLRTAREAGCDIVWPRSKFVDELPTALPGWLTPRSVQ